MFTFPICHFASSGTFAPSDLFASGEDGAYFTARDSDIFSSGSTPATVTGAVNGTITDLSGNGNDFAGSGCTLEEDANGFRYIDTVDAAGNISFGLNDLSATHTVYIAFQLGSDKVGYIYGDSGANQGIGLVLDANTSNIINGITATKDYISVNNKQFDFANADALHSTLTVEDKPWIFGAELSSVSGAAGVDWCIANTNSAGALALNPRVYAALWINRALTAQERIDLTTYFAATYGEVHKGTPYDVDILDLQGQSNMLGSPNLETTLPTPDIDSDLNKSINYKVDTNSLDFPLSDPINNNTLGQSMVPALANSWFAETGRPICSVMSASGGAALLPYASAAWGEAGALTTGARTNINEATAALALHPNYNLNKIYVIWLQGETEVINDNGTTITAANYQTALSTKATDMKTWYDANYAGKYEGMWAIPLMNRFEDSTERAGQFVAMILNLNNYNLAIVDAAAGNANLDIPFKGANSYQGYDVAQEGWAAENVHIGTRGLQEVGTLTPQIMFGSLSDPATPVSPFIGSDLFMDTSQSTKNTRTQSITTDSGTSELYIIASGHLFSTGSGQILLDATFNGVTMAVAGAIETENTGEVGSAIFYLNETLYGGSLDGVTGDVVINSVTLAPAAKTVNVINIAALYAQNTHRTERWQGNIDLISTDTASHTIEPLLGSFLINVTAANYNSATATTATVSNLTELYDSSYTITASSKTAQFVVSYGTTDAEIAVTPSIVFGASQDEIASVTAAMRGRYTGEG